MKICCSCKEEKSLDDFHKHPYNKDCRQSRCKTCRSSYMKEHYLKNKDRYNFLNKKWVADNKSNLTEYKKYWYKITGRAKNLYKKYNITVEQYEQMLIKQNYSCAICNKSQEEEQKLLAVDHDHITNKVRGLLCAWCNRNLIAHHRSSDLFEAAAKYLKSQEINIEN